MGLRVWGESDLVAGEYVIVSWISSDINENVNTDVDYELTSSGGLTAKRNKDRTRKHARERLSPEQYLAIFGEEHLGRIEGERLIRSWQSKEPLDLSKVSGTAIRDRTHELLPGSILVKPVAELR